jgi:aspartate kinase
MTKIFKFGGASVKDAESVKNIASIINRFNGNDALLCVVSAMGKTTNALESVVKESMESGGTGAENLQKVKAFHREITRALFPADKEPEIWEELEDVFSELEAFAFGESANEYNFLYDQIVSAGELLSSKIVARYLQHIGLPAVYKDARGLIRTDNTYREGRVNWTITQVLVDKNVLPLLSGEGKKIIITQGFIGRSNEGSAVTLGREGSDYSAAIFAHTLNAGEVTIWKDVPGVLNADPKRFPDAQLFSRLSYTDAIELAYYGATVIHPKTIKPLQNKNITLRVRSFLNPEAPGTEITAAETFGLLPAFIFKDNQALLSLSPKDFSFIAEDNLSHIFTLLAQTRVKVNLMENSAIRFLVCVDNDEQKIPAVIRELEKDYHIGVSENLQLITVRNYNEAVVDMLLRGKNLLAEQRSSQTVRLVVS